MKKLIYSRLLKFTVFLSAFIANSNAFSQAMKTDTVYHTVFGCDSVRLEANNTLYTANATVRIPHYSTYQSTVYMDVLNVYNIEVGRSYSVRDTVTAKICSNSVPYVYHGNFLYKSGNHTLEFPTVKGCDSAFTLLRLNVMEGERDTVSLGFCANEPSVTYEGITFTEPGVFEFVRGTDTEGCPIVRTFLVERRPLLSDTLNVSVCSGHLPYSFGGQTFNESGTYTVVHTAENGCQANTLLNLTVLPSSKLRATLDTTICAASLPFVCEGFEYYQSGNYFINQKNQYGCDSLLLKLILTVVQPHIDTVITNLCPTSFPFVYNNHSFNDFGEFFIDENTDTFCSRFTLLKILPKPTTTDTLVVCTNEDSYTFYDSVFTESGTHIYETLNSHNCIDRHVLILSLKPETVTDTLRVTICNSELPYEFYGSKYYATGSYNKILKNRNGCDSARVRLILTVNSHPLINNEYTITRNELPFIYRDSVYTEGGTYTYRVPGASGCDTIVTLKLNLIQRITVQKDTAFCANETITYLGEPVSAAGLHRFTYHLDGYDSVITLNVSHFPTYTDETLYLSVGEYDMPFKFGDSTYSTAGYHEQTMRTVHGCDSVVSVFITIVPAIINNDTIVRTICSNDLPYTIFDSSLTAAGTYRFLTRSIVSDVDSVFYVRLNVKESPMLVVPDTTYLCSGNILTLTAQSTGSSFSWSTGDSTATINVTLAGNYTVTTRNAYECSTTSTVHVIAADIPEVFISGLSTICKGSSTTLKAFGGSSYQWSNGATADTAIVAPTTATTYTVKVTNIYGCTRTGSIEVKVNELPTAVITGNNNICSNQTSLLTASGGVSYRWDDGQTLNKITVSNEGTYTVTAYDANGCSSTASLTLTVNPLPDVRILGRNTFCAGENTTLTATGAISYEWNSGEMTQSILVSIANIYTVTGIDANGCSASKSVTVSRDEVSATITGNKNFCHGQSTTLAVADDGNCTYRWFDGNTSNNATISTPGTYTVTVTNANGCQNTLSAIVSEYTMPNPQISGELSICEGHTTSLRASGGIGYVWDDGTESALINVNTTGTYSVTVTNQYGCTASTSATVLVNPTPTVTILSTDNICRGESVSITAISNGTTYNWASGQNSATINVSPTSTTTYTLLVTDDNNCSTTATKTIVVNQPPTAFITGNTTICSGDTAHLSVVGGSSYKWSNNTYGSSIDVTSAGLYSVTVSNESGCSTILNANVTVNPLPTANVTESVEICNGQLATLFADAPTGSSYTWSNGSHQNQISVRDQGTYTVTVTNSNQCSSVYSANVTVRSLPQISIVGNGEVCEGQTTMLTAVSDAGVQFQWSTNETSATISTSVAGPYTVTATNAYGCSATATRNVTVHTLPNPQISGTESICRGSSTTLTASGGVVYNWNTDGATGSSISVSPETSTSYTVTVINAYGCSANATKTVVVNDLPEISFSGNASVCQGQTANITASGAVNYVWDNGENTATAHLATAGFHKVVASNSSNCVSSDSILIVINPNPTVQISGDDHICSGTPTVLTASGALTYKWNNDDNSASITVSPTLSSSYSVTGTDANGCSATANKNILVEALPIVSINGQLTLCRGESTVLTAIGGESFLWNNGTQTANIYVSPTHTTTYTVKAFNSFGCENTETATVNVNVLPSIYFSGNTSICSGQTATINVTGGNSFVWSDGTTGSTLTTQTAGYYKVTATNSLNCKSTDSVLVNVWSNPPVSIDGDGLICKNTSTVLTASGAQTYTWNTLENTSSITVMPTQTTTYTVTGHDEHGCSSTVSKVVNVEALPDVHISGILAICHGQSTTLTASGGNSYLWSDGSTGTSISPSQQGVYSVTATSFNGCEASESVTVIDNPMPEFTLSGPGTICENTTGTLYVSGNYNYIWSNGSTDTQIEISEGGNYSVSATNNYGCTSVANINVTMLTAPFVQILGVNSLCQDESTTLIASSNGISYAWNTGDSVQTVEVMPDNTLYEVTVTGNNGCKATAQHLITTLPTYNYTVTGTICEHQTFSQYGFDIPIIDTAGTYTFSRYLTTVNGCDSTVNLLLTVNPLPRLDSITGPQHIVQYGNITYSLYEPQFVNNYEWRVSNTHWTLSNTSYPSISMSVNTNGNGILTARGINNCGYTETSINIFCNVGIEDRNEDHLVRLYPNPVHQSLFINLENAADVKHIRLYDATGRLIYSTSCDDTAIEIDCTRFANGHYTVHFIDGKGRKSEVRKIIVNNR